ncbi:MAG: PAS domain S-box protein [Marinilabiliales bacterium]|nr:PAS domain S-box protein [Marinilabiliales bacterium]
MEDKSGNDIYKILFENSVVGMSITALSGELRPNKAFCDMLGYSMEEMTGLPWTVFTHPQDIEFNKIVLDRIINGNFNSFRWDKRYLHKDGSILWVDIHTYLTKDQDGNPNYFFTTVMDVTRRQKSEAALNESEQRFGTLVREMKDGVAILDQQGYFSYANPAAESILEWKDRLTGRHFREIFLNLQDENRPLFDALCQINGINDFEYTLENREQEEKILNVTLVHRCRENRIVETFLMLRDITDQKKSEKEIRIKNEKLEQSNLEKDRFFTILAHDLRSPLSSFIGLTEIMADEQGVLPREDVQSISRSMFLTATDLFQLLENLLEWSVLRKGIANYNPEPVKLLSVVRQGAEFVKEALRQKQIALTIDIEPTLQVVCDLRMTETILRNLISNAIKYTHPGGSVTVRAAREQSGNVEISVKDSGIGMDEHMLQQLFHVNDKICRKGTAGEASAGLGLSICRELIELQGGRIWATSQVGNGSSFHLLLPHFSSPETIQ